MATIYSDVITFSSHCHHFTDKVDFITAGFPCQPFSKASSGRRKGVKDERWLWSSIIDIIRKTRPSFLFLENVANLLNEHDAFSEILSTLASLGFNAQWTTLQASEVGANHQRNRLFIFAYRSEHLHLLPNPNSFRHNWRNPQTRPETKDGPKVERRNSAAIILPNPNNGQQYAISKFSQRQISSPSKHSSNTPNPNSIGRESRFNVLRPGESHPQRCGHSSINPNNQRRNKPNLSPFPNQTANAGRPNYETNRSDWWQQTPPFSPICRVDDGIQHGMDRLRTLGNAVVPYQANVAYTYLINRAKELIQ